jgi:hypothetical protein
MLAKSFALTLCEPTYGTTVQCEDAALDFEGDSGVIGTIKTTDSCMQFDIKGQVTCIKSIFSLILVSSDD